MAGSRSHVTAEDGTFTFDLIDNMGDAYEACEELFNLVNRYEAHAAGLEIKILKLDAATQKALDQGNDITIEVEGQTYLIMQWRGKRGAK